MTLLPQNLINNVSNKETLNTIYRDVNDNKSDVIEQSKTAVRTNRGALQIPILNTKAKIPPLFGQNWMDQLGIALNATTDRKEKQQRNG